MIRLDTRFRQVRRVWFTPDGRSVAAQVDGDAYVHWDLTEPGWRNEISGPALHCNGAASADLSMTAETEREQYWVTAVVLRRGPEMAWRDDGFGHHTTEDCRGSQRRQVHRQWAEGMDLSRRTFRLDAPHRAHDADRAGEETQ